MRLKVKNIFTTTLSTIALLIVGSSTAVAQKSSNPTKEFYRSPVTFQVYLAGNVGEIRTTHFHSGIDIKASQGVGSPILAAADGYISRIGVSTSGYGKVLYITHPNGETTVYGHLNGFNSKISKWVRGRQYQKQGFKVDLYPLKSEFPVQQGDTIAFLGNTGSSGGPHLHFEIRNKYNNPVNIVKLGLFNIKDTTPPTFGSVTLYECDTVAGTPRFTKLSTVKAIKKAPGEYALEKSILHTTKPYYVVYDVIDYKDGVSNTMGIYSMVQQVDELTNYSFRIDKTSFTTSKYSSSMAEYAQDRLNNMHSIRSYVSANNPLSIYRNVRNRGIIIPSMDSTKNQNIVTVIEDDNGNKSVLKFEVSSPNELAKIANTPLKENQRAVAWNKSFTYQDSVVKLTIPVRALYDSQILEFSSNRAKNEFSILGGNIPIHKSIEVEMRIDSLAPELQSKALFINTKGSELAITKYKDGILSGKVTKLSTYRVTYDTIAPKITALKPVGNQLRFKVTDNLSGINTYKIKVDGKWQLLEYESKENLMFYNPDSNQKSKPRKVEVTVTDYSGNKTTLNL